MGEMKVKISDETEKVFREAAMKAFGYGKGSISRASERAFSEWASQNEMEEIRKMAYKEGITDPIKAIRGMLKHVKKSSVELQHEAGRIRAKRYSDVSHRR